MATYGLIEELLRLPEVWYCLTCRRCLQICPNAVKPVVLIEYLRMEMQRRELVSLRDVRRYRKLYEYFQRVRWHATAYCVNSRLDVLEDHLWRRWLKVPLPECTEIYPGRSGNGFAAAAASETRMAACFNCGECSSACPVAAGRDVFDPRTLFRMVNLGLADKLVASPAIWLCISCRSCTVACSQKVDGEKMIGKLQKLAIERRAVDCDYPYRLEQADRVIYKRFLDEIDILFGFSRQSSVETDACCLPVRRATGCGEATALR